MYLSPRLKAIQEATLLRINVFLPMLLKNRAEIATELLKPRMFYDVHMCFCKYTHITVYHNVVIYIYLKPYRQVILQSTGRLLRLLRQHETFPLKKNICYAVLYSPSLSPPPVICQPDRPSVNVYCGNRSAVLSWSPTAGAVGYSASAETEGSEVLFCSSSSSSEPTCTIGNLQCGARYNFSVQASDGTCNSSFSEPVLAGGGTASET